MAIGTSSSTTMSSRLRSGVASIEVTMRSRPRAAGVQRQEGLFAQQGFLGHEGQAGRGGGLFVQGGVGLEADRGVKALGDHLVGQLQQLGVRRSPSQNS
ncbi:hypothetical protein WJ978_20105 [Achromobacter xylosoxidans]